MKTRNKWLALLLGAVMTVGMLSGCAGTKEDTKQSSTVKESVQNTETEKEETATQDSQEENSVRISDEVLTYTVAGPYLAASMDWNNTVQFKEYENRLGIKLDATSYDSDTWKSKMTLLIASDELPDIMVNAEIENCKLSYANEYDSYIYAANFKEISLKNTEINGKSADAVIKVWGEVGEINDSGLKTDVNCLAEKAADEFTCRPI